VSPRPGPGTGRLHPGEEERDPTTKTTIPSVRFSQSRINEFRSDPRVVELNQQESSRTQRNKPTKVDPIMLQHYGDSCRIGKQKLNHIFRVFSYNVGGLSFHHESERVRQLCEFWVHWGQLRALQETHRSWQKVYTVCSYKRWVDSTTSHNRSAFSLAEMPHDNIYQRGGTALTVVNHWATRTVAKGQDKMGRWSWLTLLGQAQSKITFISAYRVCKDTMAQNTTSTAAFAQQLWMLENTGRHDLNPRQLFINNLITLIQGFQSEEHSIILTFDGNEAVGDEPRGIEQILLKCQLLNAHSLRAHGPTPPTFVRGTKTIDHIFISPHLRNAVNAVISYPCGLVTSTIITGSLEWISTRKICLADPLSLLSPRLCVV